MQGDKLEQGQSGGGGLLSALGLSNVVPSKAIETKLSDRQNQDERRLRDDRRCVVLWRRRMGWPRLGRLSWRSRAKHRRTVRGDAKVGRTCRV